MSEKDLKRCEGCGAWVYAVSICGMCELAFKQWKKVKEYRKNCAHNNLTVTPAILGKALARCLRCEKSVLFDVAINPMLETETIKNLLNGEPNE